MSRNKKNQTDTLTLSLDLTRAIPYRAQASVIEVPSPTPPKSLAQSDPASGLEIKTAPAPAVQPQKETPIGAEWIGRPLPCLRCGEILPTLRHLELVHECPQGEDPRLLGRLLSAYLYPEDRARAERLDLDVAAVRELVIHHRGATAIDQELSRREALTRERSPNSDPASLCVSYPYKTEGLPDGDKMSPEKWSRPAKTSNKIARVEAGPEYFDALEAKGDK